MNRQALSRRRFLQLTASSTSMLMIGCAPDSDSPVNLQTAKTPTSVNQFITIDSDGEITLFNHRPEMGQGTFQAIPMILAEELEVDILAVTIKQSAADPELYGSQQVVGSRSIQTEFTLLRKMGAAAREMLIQAAAQRWGVTITSCHAENARVIHAESTRQLSYAELVADASELEAPANPSLKSANDFKVLGRSIPRQDIPQKTNGSAIYGIDVQLPGMLYASIARSPVFIGTIKSFNADQVLAIPGVRHVIRTERNVFGTRREGVAVLADNYWAACKGRMALKVEWDTKGLESESTETIEARYRKDAQTEGNSLFARGDTASVIAASGNVLTASYSMPYQSHVPMEPMNAVVSVTADGVEYWGSTQNPNGYRSFLADLLQIPEDRVRINYTFMGGAFGRRSLTDVPEEAARLSREVGAPVKVIWTREDDQTQGPFRAASVNLLRAALDGDEVVALEHKIVTQEINNQTGDSTEAGRQIMGGVTTDYEFPNLSVRGVLEKHYVPISYWRAVYHSTNPFAHESFIDELAHRLGKDPLEFRLSMLQQHARFKRVLEETRQLTNWTAEKQTGMGRGIAIAERSGSHFAMVVDVSRQDNGIHVDKVTTVIDLGICVNPDTVRAQIEGSVIMGLTACLYGLTIENGAIKEQNFHEYPLLRYGECPEIETHILPSDAAPDGAGESGLPTLAPALANAIFNLSGQRQRSIPLKLEL